MISLTFLVEKHRLLLWKPVSVIFLFPMTSCGNMETRVLCSDTEGSSVIPFHMAEVSHLLIDPNERPPSSSGACSWTSFVSGSILVLYLARENRRSNWGEIGHQVR